MKALISILFLIFILGCSGRETSQPTDDILKSLKDYKNRQVYTELTKEVIDGMKDEELEQAVVDNISANPAQDGRDITDKIKSLNAGQRAIYTTWIVEAEVGKGGLLQFYTHSGKLLAGMTEEAFQTIGATQFAELMSQANLIYSAQTDKKNTSVDPYDALEDQFTALYDTEPLDQLKVKYIRSHAEEFVNK